jgi:hypothetical protein
MGPILIFDKSTVQSLSAAEARWLTHMYYSNITPVLFLEIMADLKKAPKDLRTPEKLVSDLAKKFSPINSAINVHHTDMSLNDLILGNTPEMKGKIILGGGKVITDETGKKSIFFDEPPEQEALNRWQDGQFDEFERLLAERWRASLEKVNLEAFAREFRASIGIRTTNLPEACAMADRICEGARGTRYQSLKGLMNIFGVPHHLRSSIIKR